AAGILDTLHLPATVTNLTIRNQAMLTADGLVLAGIDHIETLVLENMNSIDQPALIRSLLARSLTYVRLTGLDVADNNLNMFYSLAQLQGVDENGMNTAHAVVTGKVSVPVAYQSQIDELEAAFPELEINAAQVLADPVTTFVFASTKKDEPLTDTFFVCNRAFVKIDDVTFRVSAPPGFEIIMSFSAAEHHTTVRRHIVSITMTQNYTIQYLPDRIFIFKQYSDNSLMEGVVAVINGQTYTSDADGKITVRSIEALAGVATSAYGMANISQPSSLTAQTYNTTVYPYVNVTLYALDGLMYAPVRGIEFDIAGSLIPVDPYGFASMRLSQGAYPYTARFKGQIIKEDVLNVGTSDLALSVNNFVALEDADYFPPEDGSISFHMNPGSTLRIISDDDAYVIDWGDGTTTSATASGQVDYTHSYGIGTIRLVRILYCEGVTYARPTTTHNLLSCLSVGESGIRFDSSPLNNCSNLRLVAKDLLKNSRGKPALFFNGLFQNDSSLKSVPEGLFDGLDINNVSSLFYGCNQLESVPEHLFKDSDNITSAISVFQNCSSLTSIPSNLFSETCKPRITFFNSFFQSCGISHIVESDLTGFNLNSNNMSTSLFDNCPNLLDAVIPPNMTYIANRCFYNTSFNWIEFKSPVPPTLASTTNFDRNYPIYVPDDAVDAYRAAANWVNFASRILPVSQRPAN
ncbi:MAG: leucine-rich repeat domain-containing protein, partial [Tannerella sp.]|nr:leucine-rich repeat domain-containing protein [Tannerella sp.]